jgi:N-acetylmuramic acid 6-phosphate etherase
MSSLRRQRVSGGPGAAPVIGPERKFDRLHHTLANGLFSTSFNAGEPAMGRARLQWQNQEGQTRGPRRAGAALMETERPSPRYSAIELWNPADILETMIEGQFAAVAAVHAARPELERAALAIEARLKEGGRLVYAGAGTSGRLAVQDGAELMPTFGWPPERLLLLMAGGRDALLRAVEGAEDEVEQGARVVRQHKVDRKDVLIAVAASGTTPFTLACLCEAKACGALTVGIANNPNTPILNEADYPVYLDTGAEPIAGSTRMKAGTAQRVALTMLSSLLMIRLGRVYEGLMVDVQATNRKLVLRSEAILAQLTGHTREHVRDALARAQGNVKLALLLLEGSDIEVARATLDRARGDLRAAKTLIAARRSQQRRA